MGFPLAAAGVGIAGSAAGEAAGSALGNALGGGSSSSQAVNSMFTTPNFVNTVNNMLTRSLSQAQQQYTTYATQAVNQQNTSLNQATNAINTGTTQAGTTLSNAVGQYQSLQEPYASAGYSALDAYQDSLGLSRPTAGSQAVSQALSNNQQYNAMLAQNGGKAPTNPGTAPTAPTLAQAQASVTPQAILNYERQNSNFVNGKDYYTGTGLNPGQTGPASYLMNVEANPTVSSAVSSYLANQDLSNLQNTYQGQLSQYNSQLANYNNYANLLGSTGYNPQQAALAAQYNNTY